MDFSLITDEPLNYCVYAHVNKQNGEVYVGITNNIGRRWRNDGIEYCSSTKFYDAIKEFTWEEFDHIVLIDGITKSIASIIECELIKKYNLIKDGYNSHSGTWSVGSPDIPRPVFQYTLDGDFIRKWDDIHDAIIKYGLGIYENLSGKSHSSYDYQWSWSYTNKMQPYEKTYDFVSVKYPNKEITAYNLDGTIHKIFQSYDCLDDIYNKRVVKILCDGERKYVYEGLIWGYSDNITTEFVNDLINKHFQEINENKRSVYKYKINQYDLDGNYINSYGNAYEAGVALNCKGDYINKVCCGLYKASAGYQWRFSCDDAPDSIENCGFNQGRPVIQKDLEGNIIGYYPSALQAAEKYSRAKIPNGSKIIGVCDGRFKTAFNYKWEFITREEYENHRVNNKNVNNQEVIRCLAG